MTVEEALAAVVGNRAILTARDAHGAQTHLMLAMMGARYEDVASDAVASGWATSRCGSAASSGCCARIRRLDVPGTVSRCVPSSLRKKRCSSPLLMR